MGVVITTWLLFPCCESFPKVLADGRDDVFMTLIHDTVEVKFSGIKKNRIIPTKRLIQSQFTDMHTYSPEEVHIDFADSE